VTTDECIALSDDELVHAAYEAVDVFDVDDVLGEKIMQGVGELWSPSHPRPRAPGSWGSAEDPPDELLDAIDERRRQQAARQGTSARPRR
jgi:hypothetical protein